MPDELICKSSLSARTNGPIQVAETSAGLQSNVEGDRLFAFQAKRDRVRSDLLVSIGGNCQVHPLRTTHSLRRGSTGWVLLFGEYPGLPVNRFVSRTTRERETEAELGRSSPKRVEFSTRNCHFTPLSSSVTFLMCLGVVCSYFESRGIGGRG